VTPRYAQLLTEARRRAAASSPAQYIPHKPHPQQAKFLALACLEAMYGGAAGGGKSDALLMGALAYVHVPGYSALLLRRTYQDLSLPGAIMDRAATWLANTSARWNGTDKRWTFPSGATLSFGYLDTERDKYRYASAEFQFIGFDELTQFPEGWYRFLFSRLRKAEGMPVPLRMRSATNPGGIGHEWVKRRFLDPDDGPPFVPARLHDNPSVDQAGYLEALDKLDPNTKRQLLEGVWIRDAGGLVYRYDEKQNDAATVPTFTQRILALDFGFTDATAFAILGWAQHDTTVYVESCWKQTGMTPSEVAEKVMRLEATFGFVRIVGDIGGLGKGYIEEARRRFHLPIEAAEKNNKRGYIDLLNGDMARGRVKIARPACDQLRAEWLELPWHEDRSKEAEGFDNHCADAVLYGWRAACAYLEEPAVVVAPKPGTPEAWRAEEEAALERRIAELGCGQDDASWQDF
jgi:hypothetical protein